MGTGGVGYGCDRPSGARWLHGNYTRSSSPQFGKPARKKSHTDDFVMLKQSITHQYESRSGFEPVFKSQAQLLASA